MGLYDTVSDSNYIGVNMTFKEALEKFNNNKSLMARELGVTRQAVSLWSKKPDKELPDYRSIQVDYVIQNRKF